MALRDPWEVESAVDPWEAPAAAPARRQTPEETIGRLRSEPDYEPTPEELGAAYDNRWKVALGGIIPGIKEAVHRIAVDLPQKGFAKEAEEFKKRGALGYLGTFIPRQAATTAEGLIRGTAGLGGLGRPILEAGADMAARAVVGGDKDELAKQQWADRVRKSGEEGQAMSSYNEGERSFIPGANPAGAALVGEVADPTILLPAARAAGVAAKGAVKGAAEGLAKGGIARSAVRAAAPVVEKGAEVAANVAGKVKTGLDVAQPAVDVAGLVTGGFGGLGAAHVAGRGASAVLGWADKVRDVGTSLRAIGNADWRSAVPVWMQLAKDADAPVWLKRAASSSVAPLVEKTLQASGSVARGSAEGAAIGAVAGAANTTLTPEEKGAALGAGLAMGAGGAAVGHAAGGAHRAEVRQAHDIAVRAMRTIESGADPAAVLAAPDSLMYYADNLEKIFAGAMPNGKSLRVDLVDGAQFAQLNQQGGVAFFDVSGDQPRVVVNLEAPEADGRALHEVVGHALAESVVGSQPEILAQVRASLTDFAGGDPKLLLQAASEQYATALLGPNATPEQIAQYIIEQRAGSTSRHGDSDAWILSEIWAESTVRAMGGKDLTDLATPGFFGRAARLLNKFEATRGLAEKAEARDIAGKSGQVFPTSDKTFFGPFISQALDDPKLHKLAVRGLRDVAAFRPGVDAADEKGVKISPKDIGKVEQARLHDLGNGQKGNDFVLQTPDGRLSVRPPKQVRTLSRNRRKAVNAAVPPDAPPASATDKDPFVKVRTTVAGLVERSGRKLGDWFYRSNVFSEDTKASARALETAIENGTTLSAWYHQIGDSVPDWKESVKKDYGNIEAKFKDFVPVDFLVTKQGNLIVRNYSLSSLERKAQQWSARKGPVSLELWNGDVGQFRQDLQTYLKNHAEGRPGADGIGDQKRNVINAFLIGKNVTFGDKNPLRAGLSGQDRQGLVRSYRLDRLEPVEPSEVQGYAKPEYVKQVRNLSPTVTGESEVEQAARAAGYTLRVWRGDSTRFSEFDPRRRREFGVFTTPVKDVADKYAGKLGESRPYYVKPGRLLDLTKETPANTKWVNKWGKEAGFDFVDRETGETVTPWDALQSGRLFDWEGDWSSERWKDIQATAKQAGYDTVILPDYDSEVGIFPSVVVLTETNIKSADPETFNESGEPVPLTERFNTATRKIYHSPTVTPGQESVNLPRNEEGPTTGVPKRSFRVDAAVRGQDFAEAIRRTKAEHKLGFAVDDKGDEFYLDPKNSLFLSDDGLAGVAVTADKDLVSVFKHPESKADVKPILQEAAEASHTLDAFDVNGFLPDLYAKFGFKPVARVPFNREYAPEGWNYEIAGEPDVVLMVRDPENVLGVPSGKYGDLRNSVPSFADYGEAVAAQQAAKEKVFGGRQMSPDVGEDKSALPVEFVRNKKGEIVYSGKDPKTVKQIYNFLEAPIIEKVLAAEPDPAKARDLLYGRSGIRTKLNTSKLTARKDLSPEESALYKKIVDRYADEFVADYEKYAKDPDVAAARGWYSDVSDFVKSILPDQTDRAHFLEFLGGTSPNTDVESNYLYALDLFNRWKKGEFDGLVDRYKKVTESHRSGDLIPQIATVTGEGKSEKYRLLKEKRADFIATYVAAGVEKKDAVAIAAKPTRHELLGYFLLKEKALPLREGGGKYGIHSDRIIQILDRKWLSETDAPKAPNFTGNLEGSRRTATVDVWAARLLRRLGYEKESTGPWRVQPMSESGVQNHDFFFGQDVFDETAKRITEKEGKPMHADDLQAIAWFGEKREWAKRGWSKDEDLGDFRQYLYKTVPADATGRLKIRDGELNSASQDFINTLTTGQLENVRLKGPEEAAKKEASKKARDAEDKLEQAPDEKKKAFWRQKLEDRRAAARKAFSSEIRVTR